MANGEEGQGPPSGQSPGRQYARTDVPPSPAAPVSLARISVAPPAPASASAEELQGLMETQVDGVALMPTQTDIPVRSPVPSLQAPARTRTPVPPPPPVKPATPPPTTQMPGDGFGARVKAFVREAVEDALDSARKEIGEAITEALQPVKDRIAGLDERLGQLSDRMDAAGKKDDAHDGELDGLKMGFKDMEQILAEVGADAETAQKVAAAVAERLEHEFKGL